MNVKPFLFGLTSLLALALGMQQPVCAAKKAKDSSSSSSTHHHKKPKKVLCTSNDKKCKDCERFKYNIQLQLADGYRFPVPGTEFWITLDIVKNGPLVTVQVPLINFQTGQCSSNDPFCPTFIPGGYLYTSDGFLPECLRPNDLVPVSIVAASNNGMSPVFSFTQLPEIPLPQPPAGYIVQITNAGALQVQQAGSFGNVIAPGPQILMPCSITYLAQSTSFLCKNVTISKGASDVTQFTDPSATNIGYRDSAVNDAYDGVCAWTWYGTQNIDPTSNTTNCFVAVGKSSHGKLTVHQPIQLTNLPNDRLIFDSAVAINRTNKKNIVVSYSVFNPNAAQPDPQRLVAYRAVSTDGGKTWPINGPIGGLTYPRVGDNRGVSADKFGNFWYGSTIADDTLNHFVDQPKFLLSSDGGITFQDVFTLPFPTDFVSGVSFFDFPQYCFGGSGDGTGSYGLWFSVDYFPDGLNGNLIMGFIPINGLGIANTGPATTTVITQLENTTQISSITASNDGRVWLKGFPAVLTGSTSYIDPQTIVFKSPGAIDSNYAGSWDTAMINNAGVIFLEANTVSYSGFGYFNSVQTNIYDNDRQALYAVMNNQVPDYSQNMQIFFAISRDNGMTWSEPIAINSTNFANRGFQSMALDELTGDLIFGWYDGRNDSTYHTVEYMGAIIPAKTLDKLVQEIPLSNPLFIIPDQDDTSSVAAAGARAPESLNKRRALKLETKVSR